MSFGATQALRGIDLEVRAGEIHALVGENGAGKSTALGVIAGRITRTTGIVEVFGHELRVGDPRAAQRAGVVAIYQELTIIPALGAEENVFLGHPLARGGFIRSKRMRDRYVQLCREVGIAAQPPRWPARSMSVGDQQLLEILRALVVDSRIILFDEPTASLGEAEREALFILMHQLRERGITIVFVSHNLDEVMAVADTITVFRDGSLVESAPKQDWSKARLVQRMLGDRGDSRVAAEMLATDRLPAPRRGARGEHLVRVEGLTVPGAVQDIALSISAGEILGVAGLVGSGRSTVLRALAGLEPRATGRMWVRGREVPLPRTVRQALRLGIALLPEDRKGQGLVLGLSAMENIVISDMKSISRFGFVSSRAMERAAVGVAADFGFAKSRVRTQAGQLSGGNQQKLLLARWKHKRPMVLLADEPTRGIDLGARDEITRALEGMVGDGLGLVLVSSELAEVAAISDRIVVLAGGSVAGQLDAANGEITVSEILHEAFAVRGEA